MLPKFLTHLNMKMATRRLCCTFPLVLMSLLLVLQQSIISSAEKDFNFNDSQVPLIEPKDEPILIDSHQTSTKHQQPHHKHNHQLQQPQSQLQLLQEQQNNYIHYEYQDPYAVELSHCRYGDNEIVLSLVLKSYNWHDFNESRKARVLEKLSKFFAIPKEFITMESVTKHELFEMQKVALKKGNNKCHNNNRKLGCINFIIGCSSKYFTVTAPITKQIGEQFKTGALDNITGEKFGWWVIWNKQYKSKLVRNRRQVEGSGDDDEDEEYDYDEDYIDEPVVTTTNSHAHRHHHGDDTSEITSNMLEVTNIENIKNSNNKKNNNNNHNNINNIIDNNKNRNDDITALKQTHTLNEDGDTNQEKVIENVDKTDSNLLLLNKKDSIDEEIVESVSQLESVITKTIENTKNLDDIPEMVINQPDEDLLSEVLQPLNPIDGAETSVKVSDNTNLNSVYENSRKIDNSDVMSNSKNDFNVAEVIDSLTSSTTITTTATATTRERQNSSVFTSADVNVQENFESIIDSTTPLSFNNKHYKKDNHHIDLHSSPSSSYSAQDNDSQQQHHIVTSSTLLTEITNSPITTNSHLTSTLITDSTTSIATATTTNLNSPSSLSSTLLSLSSSTVSSNNLNKELSSNSPAIVDSDDEDRSEEEEKEVELLKSNINEDELLSTLTTKMTIPLFTTEQQQQQKHHLTHQHHHHHHNQYHNNMDMDDNNIIMAKTKATTTLLTTSPSLLSYGIDMLATSTVTTTTTIIPYNNILTTGSSSLLTPSMTTAAIALEEVELPIANGFEININNGKKDETTVEPEINKDTISQSSSTISQAVDESSVVATSTTTATPGTTTPSQTSEIISSTTALPDYIEPKIENSPPMIKSRLQKLAVTSGKSFKISVPEDTFYDNEDLSNLRLELTDKEGRELKSNSWLQFDAETKEIYGLPLDDTVSKWQYRLTATDSGNESVTETLEISVQQHRGVRTVNHEINISVKINEKNIHYIDWQLNLINAIAETLGDDNANSIVVREIRSNPQDPNTATLVYFNETLPTSDCPERELTNLVKRLDVSRLSDLVQPTLGIKQLTGQLIGPCQKTAAAKPKTPTLNIKNAPPVPRNQVDRVVAIMGHLLVYKVPSDTFFDPNDNELTLSLKTKDHKDINPRHWLQFDSKNEEFYGIPKSGDTGAEEYLLVAEDAGGLTATDALVVQVNHAPKKEFSAYFRAYLAVRHELFNADLQRKFVERIAALFGDASTQNIQIRSINAHHDSDGTVVNFYNTTLFKSHNRCPEEEMEILRNVYLHDNTLRERVKKALGSELNITQVQVIPSVSCNAQIDVTHREFIPNKTEEPMLKSTFSEDYLYTIILPAIIIVSMILIASIIACCLHRRRRKSGKMELGDEEERKSFRTKGIPVIFQDELDEKPEIGNKSPIILKDEKPPLLPPSYNTSNMNGDNDVDEYVPPPAVVVGGREARGKSPATPSYRKPPPYVSP